jgi:CHAT domain-containing protein
LTAQVRTLLAAPPAERGDRWREPIERLSRQRLEPLREQLKGVRHLLVLPSPPLRGIPLEVLVESAPAGAPRYTVSAAPSGTFFAHLQERRRKARPGRARLLALGDPAFAAAEEKSAPVRRRDGLHPLPGTRREVEALAGLFGEADTLLGADASEARLDALANEGLLKGYRYVHIATHGLASAERPLESYLSLADQNLPDPLRQVLSGRPAHTGRLTARHILDAWRLDTDLVVLSACQSGLGRYEAGEGYVGFAQALFLAGARSLVLSQWSVDDEATALLMVRFYQNLLGKRAGLKGPLPKAQALAEAKGWLRNLSPKEAKTAVASLPRGSLKAPGKAPGGARPYAHPYYWAGFILVGDPG